jgi:hypothetical protein
MFLLAPKKMPKPATPEPKRVPPSDSLVFWAKWSDGVETRMSVYTFADDLDVKRAIAVSTPPTALVNGCRWRRSQQQSSRVTKTSTAQSSGPATPNN